MSRAQRRALVEREAPALPVSRQCRSAEYNESLSGLWTRGLLIRRTIADGELAFFATWYPAGTGMETLVAVEGRRWAIDSPF
jgi:SRSO17 transposase